MRSGLIAAGVAVASLGPAACGGAANKRAPHPPGAGSAPVRVYRATLSGAANRPPGAPNGTGAAVIALHTGPSVCWRFAHLRGFNRATTATIHLGAAGVPGKTVLALSRGHRLRHQGCVRIGAALSKAIELAPDNYYVTISSTRYPAGAVRAQL